MTPAFDESDPSKITVVLERYEEAWRSASPPQLVEFLQSAVVAGNSSDADRRRWLLELIPIDLEYRWRHFANRAAKANTSPTIAGDEPLSGPKLVDYFAAFPELGSLEEAPVELLVAEYRVRRVWGDWNGLNDWQIAYSRRLDASILSSIKEAEADLLREGHNVKNSTRISRNDQATGEEPTLSSELCQRFEREFLNGLSPQLERYLRVAPECESRLLADLLAKELQLRKRANQPIEPSNYLGRFPKQRAIVVDVMSRHGISVPPSGTQQSLEYPTEMYFDSNSEDLKDPNNQPGASADSGSTPTRSKASLSKLGRYEVRNILGSGAFGEVYEAYDPQLQRTVAIKLPHRQVTATAIQTEALALAKLDHPGIVRVHDFGTTDDGRQFIVSEFIRAKSLQEQMKLGPLSFRDAALLIANVADALQYAHAYDVIHRDIKPANILVDDSGRPYLVDFGLALEFDKIGRGPELAGTISYMSPEQAGNAQFVDGRTDIFSLGAVLYELLSGKSPFGGKGMKTKEVIERLLRSEARPPRQLNDAIPAELERICLKALAKQPSLRYSTARDFARDLRRFAAQLDAPARSSRGIAAIGVATGAVVAIATWIFWPPSPPSDVDLELIWQKNGEAWTYLPRLSSDDLPLRPQDRIQIHARTSNPAYHYVLWFDEFGKASRKWPRTGESADKTTELVSPEGPHVGPNAVWWPIEGEPGYDVIVVGVSARPLTTEQLAQLDNIVVRPALGGLERGMLREFEFPSQGRKAVKRGSSENPVVSPRGILGDGDALFQSLFSAYHGWVFYHDR